MSIIISAPLSDLASVYAVSVEFSRESDYQDSKTENNETPFTRRFNLRIGLHP